MRSLSFAILSASALAGPAAAATIDAAALLGSVNNIVLNNHTASSETEGTLYVGGAFTGTHVANGDGLASFTVGGATGSVVIGGASSGRLTANRGAVVVGGSNSAQIGTNGATGSNGVTVGGANTGFIQTSQPGAISIGGANTGTLNAQNSGTVATNTGVSPSIPVADVTAAFQALSIGLSQMSDTAGAAASLSDRNMLGLTAGTADFAVLNVQGAPFGSGTFFGVANLAAQTVVVNVAGTNVTLGANWAGGAQDPYVLFNFFEATTLTVATGWNASILAPFANVTIRSDVLGTLVSYNLIQNAQVIPYDNADPFRGTIPGTGPAPVPLPAAAWMLLAGLGALTAAARARRA